MTEPEAPGEAGKSTTPPGAGPPGRSSIVCGGCGTVADPADPYPFRCPRSGDGGDHVLRRVLDLSTVSFPAGDCESNPFVRFRGLLHAYHLATAAGMADDSFVDLVRQLDGAVARVDGRGLSVTPFRGVAALAEAAGLSGPLLVKDETCNVGGSHKARHMFGLLVHLEVVDRIGMTEAGRPPELAIASCGNAALAAAIVAAAGRRVLRVFVPTDAGAAVVERLRGLGAAVEVCPRTPGRAGDPTYLRLREAIVDGAVPFTCQGNENGLAIEGGITLGYEIAAELAASGSALDHVVVQVGGGALASAVSQGLAEAVALGAIPRAPRFHTVQTEGAWPLARAFRHALAVLAPEPDGDQIGEVLRRAACRREDFMWPWETAPRSVAHGILDDETYDWLAVLRAMFATGGQAVVVGEEELRDANALAVRTTGIDVDETGSAGLAGLLRLHREGAIAPGESAAVMFTGIRR